MMTTIEPRPFFGTIPSSFISEIGREGVYAKLIRSLCLNGIPPAKTTPAQEEVLNGLLKHGFLVMDENLNSRISDKWAYLPKTLDDFRTMLDTVQTTLDTTPQPTTPQPTTPQPTTDTTTDTTTTTDTFDYDDPTDTQLPLADRIYMLQEDGTKLSADDWKKMVDAYTKQPQATKTATPPNKNDLVIALALGGDLAALNERWHQQPDPTIDCVACDGLEFVLAFGEPADCGAFRGFLRVLFAESSCYQDCEPNLVVRLASDSRLSFDPLARLVQQ